MASMIIAKELHREFRTVKRQPGFLGSIRTLFTRQYNVVRAVDHVSFSIERGELVGYIGPNGAGKSTTLKMLTGVLVPTSGYVETDGLVPHKHRQALANRMGAVFGQRSQLWWDLPLGESFRILKEVYRVPDETYQRNMHAFNELVGLDELLDTPVRQLSLGQRMRGEMVAALLHDPEIVFLDEPLIGLDVVAKERMRQFIAEINRERGVTVILASNDMADVERLCERIIIIDHGRLLYDGTVEELKRRHAPYRTLVVHFGGDYPEIQANGAEPVRRDTRRAWLRFDRTVNPQQLIADLSERYLILLTMVGLVAFWTLELMGFNMIFEFVSLFLSGGLIPLWFLPLWMRRIAEWLPFQSLAHLPLSIYIGKIEGAAIWIALLKQAAWIAVLSATAWLIWKTAERKIIVQGG